MTAAMVRQLIAEAIRAERERTVEAINAAVTAGSVQGTGRDALLTLALWLRSIE